jgi:hypothetical protein
MKGQRDSTRLTSRLAVFTVVLVVQNADRKPTRRTGVIWRISRRCASTTALLTQMLMGADLAQDAWSWGARRVVCDSGGHVHNTTKQNTSNIRSCSPPHVLVITARAGNARRVRFRRARRDQNLRGSDKGRMIDTTTGLTRGKIDLDRARAAGVQCVRRAAGTRSMKKGDFASSRSTGGLIGGM